jgi:putative hydrolase of the HAD superfamily
MIDWSRIDTVLLDMDGTLLDLYFDNYFWLEFLPQRYASHHGCELPEARRFLTELSDTLHGSLDWYCLDYWSGKLQMDVEALKTEVQHLIRFRPGTPEFLAFLQQQGKTALLVTNAHPRALRLKLRASGLDRLLQSWVSSHDFALAKENTGFWLRLQAHAGLDFSRCLFIDDSLSVLRCARSEGLQHTLQVLQPDTTLAPREPSEFPGIVHFSELMPA